MDSTRGPELCLLPQQGAAVDVLESEEATVENLANSSPARDWSQLQQDLLIRVFSRLEVPDLVYSGAVCLSWHQSYLAIRRFQLCSREQSPYLVYSSEDRDCNTATLHNVCTSKVYHAPLPDPPFRSRYIIGSSHGWLVTADEFSRLHLLNPVTGAQLALPPPQTIKGVRESFNSDGVLIGHSIDTLSVEYRLVTARSDPSWDHLSFARVGDTKWTWLDAMERCNLYHDFFFHGGDRLFYAIRNNGEVHTIDLNGSSPAVNVVFSALSRINCYTHYILLAPWGDLLQIRRLYGDPPSDDSASDSEQEQSHDELGDSSLGEHEFEEDEEETSRERDSLTVHRVDLAEQKVTEIKDLQDHVIFVGFNKTFMVHTRDFPNLSPNCIYVSDDNSDYIYCHPFKGRFMTRFSLKDAALTDLSFSKSLMDWPPPVWFRPHLT
ncbi:hypothetical protein EJB05_15950, partial [Eragrostis curvula]